MKNLYYVEITDITDMFSGEANYSWLTRHVVRAKSERGAVNVMSRRTGMNWRFDGMKYMSKSGEACMFIDMYEEEYHGNYSFCSDDRKESEK